MPEGLGYNYEIVINTIGRNTLKTKAKDDWQAIRNVLFRVRGKGTSTPRLLAEANQVYDNHAYSVVSKTPVYSDVFDTSLLDDWERDINAVKKVLRNK